MTFIGLYAEKYKILVKEIKVYLNKWSDIPCSWIGKFNTVKMSSLIKLSYRFNAVSIKIAAKFFIDIDKLTPK